MVDDEYLWALWRECISFTREGLATGYIHDPEDIYRFLRYNFVKQGANPIPTLDDFKREIGNES